MPKRSKRLAEPLRIRLKKNDIVQVMSGDDAGAKEPKRGRVLSVDETTGRVLVEGVNMVKRHTRPNPAKQIKGGIAEKEAPLAVSNIMIVCPKCGPVRIAFHTDQVAGGRGRKNRVCRKCGLSLDNK